MANEHFQPTLGDIHVVRAMLVRAGILPELVESILDSAEYWARSTSRATLNVKIYAHWVQDEVYRGERFLLRSCPVGFISSPSPGKDPHGPAYHTTTIEPRPIGTPCSRKFFQDLLHNPPTQRQSVRKVVFRIRSHDQGWTTDERSGPFIAAKTWFDVGIERFDADHSCEHCANERQLSLCKLRPIEPQIKSKKINGEIRHEYAHVDEFSRWEIQRNKVAEPAWVDYEITWTCKDVVSPKSPAAQRLMEEGKGQMDGDGQFVRSLELGDVITIWGKARDRAWVNSVESAQIDIYWAI